jgi:hypothetical protein
MQQDRLLQGGLVTEMAMLRAQINISDAPDKQLQLIDLFFSDRERVLDTCTEPGRFLQ